MIRVLIPVCGLLMFFYGYAVSNDVWPFEGMTAEDRGMFGDSWGAFTSVFSALGFCGILWTIHLQIAATKRIEQDSVRRDESERLRDFENSFFNMLTILQTIIKDMRVGGDSKKINKEGRSVFTHYYVGLRKFHNKNNISNNINSIDEKEFSLQKEKSLMVSSFEIYFKGRSGNFSHYYRYLYNIFRFIDESGIDGENKIKYARILRAQISNYELIILFYNGLSKHGANFLTYFKKYHLFDNLPTDKLISDVHVLLLDISVWGENIDALEIIDKAKLKGIK